MRIRPLDRTLDRDGVLAVDTAFETSAKFELVAHARSLELVETPLAVPLTKRYSIGEVFAPWASWDHGWVADDAGAIGGFATCGYEAWHRRVNLWFLYLSPPYRRRGLGRQLLAAVEAHGRMLGASHVWLETSSVNVPGVRAYERLGYTLCGADRTYYDQYMPGESALFLTKPLAV